MRRLVTVRKAFAACIAALVVVAANLVGASGVQDDEVETRIVRVAGIQAEVAMAFFDTLRRNVGRDERRAACGLIDYPLRHASGIVARAEDCEARYDRIFTPAVRKAIGTQQFKQLFVSQSGVMIGNGEVWFAGRCAAAPCREVADVRITTINSDGAALQPPRGKVLLECLVSGQRVRVASDGEGGASLTVWRTPGLRGTPDLEFPRAEPVTTPPSECGSRAWTFADGTRTYLISDLPCDAYLSPPPMGSVGRVTLSTPASPGTPLWCVE
jgi:hypothetical protein